MPPLELTGFIFDESRGRYFPISSTNQNPNATRYNREDIKRRKTDKEKKSKLENLKTKQSEIYQKYWLELCDPYEKVFGQRKAYDFIGGIERERHGYNIINHKQGSDRHSLAQSDFRGSYIFPYLGHSGSTNLLVRTRNTILKIPVNGPESGALFRLYQARTLEGRSFDFSYRPEALIKRFDFDRGTKRAFIHLHLTETYIHHFGIEHLEHLEDTPHWCRVEFKSNENVYDSVNIGTDVVVAFNNKLVVIPWDSSSPRLIKVLDKKNKSDILSLAVGYNLGTGLIYAGCRDGSMYTIPFNESFNGQSRTITSTFEFKSIKKINFPNIRSILNIKSFDIDGMVAVSGITNTNTQALFVVDALTNPIQMIIKFQTSFCNLTRDNEIFETSSDGHYICYGTRSGKGSFELFSTHMEDNLVTNSSNPVVYYPIISQSNQFLNAIKYTHLRTAAFGYYINDWEDSSQRGSLRLFIVVESERKDDEISSTIVSTSL